jgi:hypothetical protein
LRQLGLFFPGCDHIDDRPDQLGCGTVRQINDLLAGGTSMAQEVVIQKSLVDQILDDMFSSIQGRDEFDEHTIRELRRLAASADLGKATHVIRAIKSTPEGEQ